MAEELHVVFGTGPVGRAVVGELLEKGKRVRAVSRSGRSPKGVEGSFETKAADGTDRSAVLEAASGATHLYHCMNPQYHQWASVLPKMQENLIEAALANDALLAAAENLYMYARSAHGVSAHGAHARSVDRITEDTPVDPPTRKGRIRRDLHERLREEGERRGLRWVTVRASDYYGPWSEGQSMFGSERFLDPLFSGKKPAMIGRLDVPHTYTYVEDFGRALVLAADEPEAWGRAWIVPNDRTLTTGETADLFCDIAGKPRGVKRLPDFLLSGLGLFSPVIRELPEMMYQKNEPYVVDGSRFAERFGFRATPLEDGIRETLAWYRSARGGT